MTFACDGQTISLHFDAKALADLLHFCCDNPLSFFHFYFDFAASFRKVR